MTSVLPMLDAKVVDSILNGDVRVQVVDAINIGQSRAQQIDALEQKLKPENDQVINELIEDEEHLPAEKSFATKYTVKDSANVLTFLLPSKPLKHQLRLGCFVTVKKETRIWRSVLCPRPDQIFDVIGGVDLTIEQQLNKLRSMESEPDVAQK